MVRPRSISAFTIARAFLLGVGIHDDERILDAPVGGVGHVRDARHAVELDVVLARDRGEAARHLAAQAARLGELVLEGVDRDARRAQELGHVGAALRVGIVARAPLVDFVEAMAHRPDQHVQAPRAVEEVVLQVGIALHHPDVAQHFVEHARGAAGHALRAQLVERVPCILAEQADHDLAVGERRVVVGDFAQACGHGGSIPQDRDKLRAERTILPQCSNRARTTRTGADRLASTVVRLTLS